MASKKLKKFLAAGLAGYAGAKMLGQKKEMKEDALGSEILPRRRATGPAGQEVEQGPLLSKVPTLHNEYSLSEIWFFKNPSLCQASSWAS